MLDLIHKSQIADQIASAVYEERKQYFKPFELDCLVMTWHICRYWADSEDAPTDFSKPFCEEDAIMLFHNDPRFYNSAKMIHNGLLLANKAQFQEG